MGGGAWPFLVRGMICLLNCDNERDFNLLTSYLYLTSKADVEFVGFFTIARWFY